MLSNRPLFPTLADQGYFVWTDAGRTVREAVLLGRNTAIVGARGAGKTSLLHMVEYGLRELDDRPVAFASLAGVEDSGAAVLAVHRAAVDQGWLPADDPHERALRDRADPFAPTALLRQLSAAPPGATMLVDDVGSTAGAALFGRMRDELWQLGLIWAAAALPDHAGALLSPPADAFFERHVVLGDLHADERRDLLSRRGSMPAARLAALAQDGPGNPRDLVAFARDAEENGVSPQSLAVAAERRRTAAETAAGRAGGMLVTELDGLGPVSAGDVQLLDRLGWDRPRAARTLSRLEQAGLVRSYLEPRDGRNGRPRKLYELVPAVELLAS